MKDALHIQIAGAGLVGSLLALGMAKKGHTVDLWEYRSDSRKAEHYAGKSINLALSDRGWKALEQVGIADEVRKHAIPMYRRVMHAVDGSITTQNYGTDDQAIYSVSRGGLNNTMVSLAEEHPNVSIHFEHKCVDVDLKNTELLLKDRNTAEEKRVSSDLIFGTDGAYSKIRSRMQRTARFDYSQDFIDHGYKELEIPANPDGSHQLEKNALHIWPRGEFMLIALPNIDGSFTCTLFLAYEGSVSFEALQSDQDITSFFQTYFPDIPVLIPEYLQEFNTNPTAPMVIIRCYPWVRNQTALLGDASHAIVPFYGQGMNSGFEDCSVLREILEHPSTPKDWSWILDKFQKMRKPNADAIADLALYNFIEMRDKTADPTFLLQKKIEKRLLNAHPEKWVPLYTLVTFSPETPYAEAQNRGEYQQKIMNQIFAEFQNIEEIWQSKEVENRVLALLQEHPYEPRILESLPK